MDLEPDTTVPLHTRAYPSDPVAAARAMFATAQLLAHHGANAEPDEADRERARDIMTGSLPLAAVDSTRVATHLGRLLSAYDQQVIKSFAQVRQYVIHRLIEESEAGQKNPLRALELLGKVTGVDAFTERAEITVHTKSTGALTELLKSKLAMIGRDPAARAVDVTDVEMTPAPVGDPAKDVARALERLTARE
jgi:hypothetical protein